MPTVSPYKSVEGLHIDVPLKDSNNQNVLIAVISAQKFFVIPPGKTESDEEEWTVTLVEPNILRHTVPEGADLQSGKYKVQPYIETVDGYKGRCKTVSFKLERFYK